MTEEKESAIDTSDIPELDASFWEKARLVLPRKDIMKNIHDDFNSVLSKEYRNYHYKIYLDAERECLSGEVREFNGYGNYDSDSLSHLKEQLERAIDDDINCKYSTKLAEENKKLRDWAKLHNCEYPFRFGEN